MNARRGGDRGRPTGSWAPEPWPPARVSRLSSHALKAGSRALINTSPEPVTNWAASVTEDVATVGGLALVFAYPWVALAIVLLVSATIGLALWWVWRKLFGRRKAGVGVGKTA